MTAAASPPGRPRPRPRRRRGRPRAGTSREQHPRGEQGHDRAAEREHEPRERGETALERRRRRGRGGREARDLAQLGADAGRADDHGRATPGDARAGVEHRLPVCERHPRLDRGRRLLDRVRLAGQQRLVDGQSLGARDPAVGGNAVPLADDDEIARNELRRGHRLLPALADDARLQLTDPAQGQERALGTGLLDEAEDGVQHHDRCDHGTLEPLPDRGRDGRGGQQQGHQRVGELAQRDPGVARPLRRRDEVRPRRRQPNGGLVPGQTVLDVGAERLCELLGRNCVRRQLGVATGLAAPSSSQPAAPEGRAPPPLEAALAQSPQHHQEHGAGQCDRLFETGGVHASTLPAAEADGIGSGIQAADKPQASALPTLGRTPCPVSASVPMPQRLPGRHDQVDERAAGVRSAESRAHRRRRQATRVPKRAPRRPARAAPAAAARPDLDALASGWQRALDADERALAAAVGSLSPTYLKQRRRELAQERRQTADLLVRVARARGARPLPWLSPVQVTKRMLGLAPDVDACLFDLDGVLTNSALLHASAWATVFDEFLLHLSARTGWQFIPFDPVADYRSYIDGRSRLEGVHRFLEPRIRLPEGRFDDPAHAETASALARRRAS